MFRVVHAGILSGQFEAAGNIMPLWQAYTPPPHIVTITTAKPGDIAGAVRWRNISRCEPDAGYFALEFPYQLTALSALVSGCRRAYLYHAQVSTGPTCSKGNTGRNFRVELLAAGRNWPSLLHSSTTFD